MADEKLGRALNGWWQKGHSGNASGRPKQDAEFKALLDNNSVRCLRRILEIAFDASWPEKLQLQALSQFLDRAKGKARQSIEISDGNEVKAITDMSTEELKIYRQQGLEQLFAHFIATGKDKVILGLESGETVKEEITND